MLIECPSCHARAKLPDSKEGAKVRCGECGRVYLALPAGAGGARGRGRSGSSTGLILGISVAVVALIALVLLTRGGEPAKAARVEKEPVQAATTVADELGWSSEAVQTAVRIHEAAHAYDGNRLRNLLHGPAHYALLQHQGDEPPVSPGAAAMAEFAALDMGAREVHLAAWVERMLEGDDKDLIANWRPYDGNVVAQDDQSAVVRVSVTQREPDDGTKRIVEWHLLKDGGKWKAWRWQRWLSPEELKAARAKRDRGYEKVTLSDGSVVFEREPEPLPHLDDTPPELRQRIDELYATMIDLNLTREAAAAQRELERIGRPAIPKLLTGLYEIPLDTEENAIRCNLVDQTLRSITGQYFGYEPQVLIGSATGTTEERRQSAIKQWFAWWYREGDDFVAKEVVDGLEGEIQLTEKEEQWLERND